MPPNNNSILSGSSIKSRAQQRFEAFIGPRIAQGQHLVEKSKGRDIGGNVEGEALSPAAYRLQQLQLFRQMKQIAALAPPPVTRGRGSRDAAVAGQLNWVPLGPLGVEKGQAETMPVVSGRVKSIAVAPGGQRVYIATANGGVWYSGNSGKTWRSLFDQFDNSTSLNAVNDTDSLSCGAIAIVPGAGNSTDRIYVGTGEGNGMNDAYLGVGPLMSPDGGLTWIRETGTPGLIGQGFYAMVIDPDDPNHVIAGTSSGLYTRDASGAWTRQGMAGNAVTGLTVAKGATGKRFYASVWISGAGNRVFTSTDGDNWTAAGTGFPTNRIGRTTVAAHPTTPELCYALVTFDGPDPASPTDANPMSGHFHGVYRLDTRVNNTWWPVSTGMPGNLFGSDRTGGAGQGWYDNWIVVSPNNPNRFFLAGSTVESAGAWSGSIFRCDVQAQQDAAGNTVITGSNVYIGGSTHADVHNLAFTPNDPEQLWVGCDGGIYMTRQASGSGNIFQSLNAGLQTLTMNHLGMHPDEEDTFFCSAQDNGGLRYFGEDIWQHSFAGDSGFCLINWKRRNEVLSTYNNQMIDFSNNYGKRDNTINYLSSRRNVPIVANEVVQFYAPIVNIPFKPGLPDAQADMVAFGSDRPWITTNFASSWFPLPSRNAGSASKHTSDAAFTGNAKIRSLAFADSKNLLVGVSNGRILKYTDSSAGNDWTTVGNPTRLDTAPGSGGITTDVMDLVVHPINSNQFYAVFGGVIGSKSHIWFFDGTNWNDKSGTGADVLLDVHFNTLVIHPDIPDQMYAGCDLGVWRSINGGSNWTPFSNGLPETAIIDLHISSRNLPGGGKLTMLRASTYGRGVFECNISPGAANTPPVQLYLRDNILDRGRFATRRSVADPRNLPNNIPDLDTPDIKVDVPDATGLYQFPAGEVLSSGQFTLSLSDKFGQIPVPASGKATSRVYVQVHSHGISPAYNVQVVLMIKELSAGTLPDLPTNYDTDIRAGVPINRTGWQTIGIQTVQGVQAGVPRIVVFDLPSTLLPAHASLGGGKDMALAAVLHCPQFDEYVSTGRALDPAAANSVLGSDRKITAKQVKVIQSPAIPSLVVRQPLSGFVLIPESATAPEAPYDAFLAQAFRINDALIHQLALGRFALPLSNRGTDGVVVNPDPRSIVFADTITITADASLQGGIPLIWFARKRIVISQKINAKTFGAPRTGDGDFGGGGGGGASAGKNCVLPRTSVKMVDGGAIGNNDGKPLTADWASRALLQLPFCKGGGAGGDQGASLGGLGGGVVILCAPVIEFSGTGSIDASGGDGAGNAGGGGGGLIALVCRELINLNDAGPNPNVLLGGGRSAGTGGKGGAGFLLRRIFQ